LTELSGQKGHSYDLIAHNFLSSKLLQVNERMCKHLTAIQTFEVCQVACRHHTLVAGPGASTTLAAYKCYSVLMTHSSQVGSFFMLCCLCKELEHTVQCIGHCQHWLFSVVWSITINKQQKCLCIPQI